jgi:hypothetical protein
MAYEIFTRKVTRSASPTIGFSKIGQIRFNQAASLILQKDAVEHVLLLWDQEAHKIAIKSISNKKDTRAYRVLYMAQGNGAGFSAKTFLDHIGFDYSERRTFPVDISRNNEMLVEIEVPETFLKRRPRIFLKGQKGAAG